MEQNIENAIVEVTKNVFILTTVIISIYPVIYIIRSMIQFISKAFNAIDPKKLLSFNYKKNK